MYDKLEDESTRFAISPYLSKKESFSNHECLNGLTRENAKSKIKELLDKSLSVLETNYKVKETHKSQLFSDFYDISTTVDAIKDELAEYIMEGSSSQSASIFPTKRLSYTTVKRQPVVSSNTISYKDKFIGKTQKESEQSISKASPTINKTIVKKFIPKKVVNLENTETPKKRDSSVSSRSRSKVGSTFNTLTRLKKKDDLETSLNNSKMSYKLEPKRLTAREAKAKLDFDHYDSLNKSPKKEIKQRDSPELLKKIEQHNLFGKILRFFPSKDAKMLRNECLTVRRSFLKRKLTALEKKINEKKKYELNFSKFELLPSECAPLRFSEYAKKYKDEKGFAMVVDLLYSNIFNDNEDELDKKITKLDNKGDLNKLLEIIIQNFKDKMQIFNRFTDIFETSPNKFDFEIVTEGPLVNIGQVLKAYVESVKIGPNMMFVIDSEILAHKVETLKTMIRRWS